MLQHLLCLLSLSSSWFVKVPPETRFMLKQISLSDAQLFYKSGRLRVVISTANLVDFDWRDIENVCPTWHRPLDRARPRNGSSPFHSPTDRLGTRHPHQTDSDRP